MRRLAVALALLAGACGGGSTDASGPAVPSRPVETAPVATDTPAHAPTEPTSRGKSSTHLARTLAYVSELRSLEAKKPVPGQWLARPDLVARVRDNAQREFPPEVLRREGLVLQLMDFAPPGFDYLAETLKLLELKLEGFYEPKDGTMYIAADLHGEDAEATLAHELVHALQDQHWDLRTRSTYRPGRSDETLALAALAEGDAMSVMLDFIFAEQNRTALDIPDQAMRGIMTSSMQLGDVQSVPHILRMSLMAPYIEGLSFVNTLRRRGKWRAVDGAWNELPKTTEQILHVEKFEKREPAIRVPTPTAAALGPGFSAVDEDTSGELGFALMFGEWMTEPEARTAASGWGGDRSLVVMKGDEIAVVDHLRYDPSWPDDAFASRAYGKIAKGLSKKYGKAAIENASFVCFERKTTGPLAVLRRGRDLVITAGPAKFENGAWASTSTCTVARTWAEENAQARAQASRTSESPAYEASVWMR